MSPSLANSSVSENAGGGEEGGRDESDCGGPCNGRLRRRPVPFCSPRGVCRRRLATLQPLYDTYVREMRTIMYVLRGLVRKVRRQDEASKTRHNHYLVSIGDPNRVSDVSTSTLTLAHDMSHKYKVVIYESKST
jgi:hypothetical protein